VQHIAQRQQHFPQVHRRRQPDHIPVMHLGARHHGVAFQPGQGVDFLGGLLVALVLHEPANQIGARIVFFVLAGRRARQQHPRFDLREDRRHHQIVGGQLEAQFVHHFDVAHVLPGDLGHRNVEDIEVLSTDQVQQEVQRTLERLEDDRQRIRRDVQVLRHFLQRQAADDCQRHFLLATGGGWIVRAGRRVQAGLSHSDAAPPGHFMPLLS
jgi:hypothetical protein